MTEPKRYSIADSIRDARQSLAQELRSQAEQLEKLEREFAEVRQRHQRLEEQTEKQWAAIESAGAATPQGSPDAALEKVLSAVRNLITCTLPEQVLEALGAEASHLGVRAAVFDVRGKAAWGASVSGFGPLLTDKVIRSLIVPLNQDNPFRQVCETGDHVDASAEALRKNRNVLDKLKPAAEAPILLLPVRSAGTVSAILYADPSGEGAALPMHALKILSEFAGAQLDRLMALSGGLPTEEVKAEGERPPEAEAPVEEAPIEPSAKAVEAAPEPVMAEAPPVTEPAPPPVEVGHEAAAPVEVAQEAAAPPPPEPEIAPAPVAVEGPPEVSEPAPPVETPVVEAAAAPPPPPAPPVAPAESGIAQLSEAEQKVHKDAKRFAKLLVTEIELYNKVKVADGRKNKDLYKRLKSDIDRSRQTYDKRFGKVLPKEFDYFHEELVSTLGANDASALGPGYPGPSA